MRLKAAVLWRGWIGQEVSLGCFDDVGLYKTFWVSDKTIQRVFSFLKDDHKLTCGWLSGVGDIECPKPSLKIKAMQKLIGMSRLFR